MKRPPLELSGAGFCLIYMVNYPYLKSKPALQCENQVTLQEKIMNSKIPGAGFAIGIAIGVAIGVALDNIAIGLGLGVALGVAFNAASQKKDEPDKKDGDQNQSK